MNPFAPVTATIMRVAWRLRLIIGSSGLERAALVRRVQGVRFHAQRTAEAQ
jgi:hypothetical protein